MTGQDAKAALAEMLDNLTAGSILHLLAEVIRESDDAELDEQGREQRREAEAALFVFGLGLDAAMPR